MIPKATSEEYLHLQRRRATSTEERQFGAIFAVKFDRIYPDICARGSVGIISLQYRKDDCNDGCRQSESREEI